MATSRDMVDRKLMLTNHALVVIEVGVLCLSSAEELKEVIFHNFDVRKHEVHVYHSFPEPFILIFSDWHGRDVVFIASRVIEEALELHFKTWDLDDFGDTIIIPFHVKLSIEGIQQHAWSTEIANKVLCDEAIVHHVEEATGRRADHMAFHCWAFSKDLSRIPQVVFLTLTEFEEEQHSNHLHFVRPRGIQHVHVTKVLIHIDAIEDLTFYHYPREELVADGKVPWRDFTWHSGRPDGQIEEDEVDPPTRFYSSFVDPHWSRRDDDNDDRDHKHHK
jgi:hypothetical protein